MTGNGDKPTSKAASSSSGGKKVEGEQPGWANGLRALYDSVLDEPLPDSFKELLSKLDDRDA